MRLIFLPYCIFCSSLLVAGWHDRKAEGWAWYEDRAVVLEKEPEKKNAQEEIADSRKLLEEKLSKALLDPTPQNVMAYMEEQKRWVDRSAQFALLWNQVLLQHPHLDNTVTSRPVSQYGLQIYKVDRQEKKERMIHNLSKDKGLLFFYEGGTLLSKAFLPIVKDFSKKYQWELLAISVDGVFLEELSAKNDNGLSKKMGIQTFPALMIIDPKTNSVTPIAYGLLSVDRIEENIALQYPKLMEN